MLNGVGFEILLTSPPDYNGLVAEIFYDGKFVILVNQERGVGLFEIETPGVGLIEAEVIRRVDLRGFMAALEMACQRLSAK